MRVLADILGTRDLIGIAIIAVVVLTVLFLGRRVSVSVKGVTASVEAAAKAAQRSADHAATKAEEVAQKVDAAHSDLKETVGEANGNGPLMQMAAKILGGNAELFAQYAELRVELSELNERLERRTQIVRQGHSEPEDLAPYTQDRMHDVLQAIGAVKLEADTLWRFLQDDYQLPDLPSLPPRK